MTKYICHGCGKIYDDEIGMPGRCCDKVIRHVYYSKSFSVTYEGKEVVTIQADSLEEAKEKFEEIINIEEIVIE